MLLRKEPRQVNICKFLSEYGEAVLYLHREQVSRLTALHTALPDCINLHLCAFNLIKTRLIKSWSYAVVGKRALTPWAGEGCPAPASPATFHQDKGEIVLSMITLIPYSHFQPSSMVPAPLCALPGQSHWRLLRRKKNCLLTLGLPLLRRYYSQDYFETLFSPSPITSWYQREAGRATSVELHWGKTGWFHCTRITTALHEIWGVSHG